MKTTGLFHAAAQPSDADRTRYTSFTETHPAIKELPATWDAIFSLSDSPFDPDGLVIMEIPPAGQDGHDLDVSMAGTQARFSLLRHQPGAYSIVATDRDLEMRKVEVQDAPGEDQRQAMVFISWAMENCPTDRWPELEARLADTWEYVAKGVRMRSEPGEPDAAAALPPPTQK